ncbi:MAG TPA: hypothetical protein VEC02_02875 [Nitrososphaerales archaeon]|nr:hypothetical protein [Nitrososphaerales archaeon]
MNSRSGLLGVAALLLLVLPGAVAAATTYTYIQFNCSPTDTSGQCSTPINGVLTISYTTVQSTTVPLGGNHWTCVDGVWNSEPDGSGISDGSCATPPYTPPGPACSSTVGFVNYQITQVKVYTPADPTSSDIYMLGSSTGPGITSIPITLSPSQTLNLNFGPGTSPVVIGGHTYVWWRISLNGHPVYPNQNIITSPTPSPTGVSGKYLVDFEGTMHCGKSATAVNQGFFFDIGFFFSTPQFGSLAVAMGAGSFALLLMRKRLVPRKF